MPHERRRHLSLPGAPLFDYLKISPLVGLLGHRQVGKTTLLESISSQYITFDDGTQLEICESNPKKFLDGIRTPLTVIDECQLCTALFPALKERVRKNKRPGQLILSGSVRFSSKQLIQESLTGRIMNTELLPMTLSELSQRELPHLIPQLLRVESFESIQLPEISSREHAKRMKLIALYLEQGGLPGVCFIRKTHLRNQKILEQIETLLNRDLRQVYSTQLSYREILSFVRALAVRDGQPPHYALLKKQTGLSALTQKKLLYALEAVFILRVMPIEGTSTDVALVFEDQAEALVLSQGKISTDTQWRHLVYRNLREQLAYRVGENAEFFQYRTRGGAFMPICIRSPNSVLGILPIRGPLEREHRATAQSFLGHYSNAKVLFASDQPGIEVLGARTMRLPVTQLVF